MEGSQDNAFSRTKTKRKVGWTFLVALFECRTEEKEENITQHGTISTNHQEANWHLSNKKALYYNMKIYYDSTN